MFPLILNTSEDMKLEARRFIQALLRLDLIPRMVRLQRWYISNYYFTSAGHHLTLSDIQENVIQGTDVHLYDAL
jgi:hypothetical protein